jgi:SEC-C motif-containing protein
MSVTNLCPCGSELDLVKCCLPILEGKKLASTAEELLRARYTAFTQGAVDFILSTHHSKTRHEVKREEIEDWSKNSEWLGLKIVQSDAGKATDDQGTIIFGAQYRADGKINDHWERSQFEKENGEWKFLDAQGLKPGTYRRAEPKMGRNDPCTCGSGKKFKKCCGASARA